MKGLLLASLLLSAGVSYGAEGLCVAHIVVPTYPHLARMASLQGSVSVNVEISSDGKVISAKGSGTAHKLLITSSEENIRLWTFAPSGGSGPSPTIHTIIYVYRLEGRKLYYDPPPTVVLDLPNRVEVTTHPPEPQP